MNQPPICSKASLHPQCPKKHPDGSQCKFGIPTDPSLPSIDLFPRKRIDEKQFLPAPCASRRRLLPPPTAKVAGSEPWFGVGMGGQGRQALARYGPPCRVGVLTWICWVQKMWKQRLIMTSHAKGTDPSTAGEKALLEHPCLRPFCSPSRPPG